MSESPSCSAGQEYRFPHVDPRNEACVDHILKLTRGLARRRFAGWRDVDERVADAQSVAWEFAQQGKGTPATVAYLAIRRAASNGQFSRSRRSIDHHQIGPKAMRKIGGDHAPALAPNPAEEVTVRLHFDQWVNQLSPRLRRVAMLLATGLNTVDVTEIIGITRGGISMIRRELIADYRVFAGNGGL
ncbi:MAG: sigma-70 family RNA polymerase sigma factor [Planctomycetaceae bacterium]|nr:sigma-70 family RNA polymerase sigma factor [Planctomycetaceae bacterium]